MEWEKLLKGNPMPWLLEPDSLGVRYLALRDLAQLPIGDPELVAARQSAHTTGPIATVLENMTEPGFWSEPGPGYNPKYRSTVWSISLLAQLGASLKEDERLARACAYIADHALTPGGQFSSNGAPSGTADCLQGNLCWSLLELGFQDARLQTAFDWMARSITGEGVAPSADRQAKVRYYAGKCGPTFACGANYELPCAWGAAKVLLAFGNLPPTDWTPVIEKAIRQGVDFLFSVDPATGNYPHGNTDKPSGNWWKFGFPVFYVTDLLQIAEALVGLGYEKDPRLANIIQLILDKQDTQGRWLLEYTYTGKTWVDFGPKKQPNKWVTLRALRVLQAVLE
jgi:hypothetical protein